MADSGPLVERLLDDQSLRRGRGERPLVEDYLRAHPQLAAEDERLLDLVNHEVLLRKARCEAVTLDEYMHRFPAPCRDRCPACSRSNALLEAEPEPCPPRRWMRESRCRRRHRWGHYPQTPLPKQSRRTSPVTKSSASWAEAAWESFTWPGSAGEPAGGAEDDPGRRRGRAGRIGPLPYRGRGRGASGAPEHRSHLRGGAARRPALFHARVREGRQPGAALRGSRSRRERRRLAGSAGRAMHYAQREASFIAT